MPRLLILITAVLVTIPMLALDTGDLILATSEKLIEMKVQVARTPEEWQNGLKGLPDPGDENGLLLLYPREKVTAFSTHSIPFPIDIILINKYSRVIHTIRNVLSEKYVARTYPILAALELSGGFCDKHGIRVGDYIQFNGESIKARQEPGDREQEIELAATKLRKNIEIHPNDPEVYEELAEFYLGAGNGEKAETLFLSLLKKGETAPRLNGLGMTQARLGRLDDAISHFLHAIEIDPLFHRSYRNLIQIYSRKNQPTNALTLLEKAAKLHPNFIEIQVDLASLLLRMNEIDEAGKVVSELLDTQPENPDAVHLSGDIHLRQGQFTEAAENYLQYLKIRPYDPHAAELRAFITVHLIRKEQLKHEK